MTPSLKTNLIKIIAIIKSVTITDKYCYLNLESIFYKIKIRYLKLLSLTELTQVSNLRSLDIFTNKAYISSAATNVCEVIMNCCINFLL